jgi:hypothetical protein
MASVDDASAEPLLDIAVDACASPDFLHAESKTMSATDVADMVRHSMMRPPDAVRRPC